MIPFVTSNFQQATQDYKLLENILRELWKIDELLEAVKNEMVDQNTRPREFKVRRVFRYNLHYSVPCKVLKSHEKRKEILQKNGYLQKGSSFQALPKSKER